jgi:putative redox protein
MAEKVKIKTEWTGDMSFEATVGDHSIQLDAAPESGGKNNGMRPKPLMLVALAGCTGMDVVSILKKMRVPFEAFDISVEADMAEEHPKVYTSMKVIYTVKGKDVNRENVEKAVNLSKDKYCGVSAFYGKVIDIEFEIKYID